MEKVSQPRPIKGGGNVPPPLTKNPGQRPGNLDDAMRAALGGQKTSWKRVGTR